MTGDVLSLSVDRLGWRNDVGSSRSMPMLHIHIGTTRPCFRAGRGSWYSEEVWCWRYSFLLHILFVLWDLLAGQPFLGRFFLSLYWRSWCRVYPGYTQQRLTAYLWGRRARLWLLHRIGMWSVFIFCLHPAHRSFSPRISNYIVVQITPPGIASLGWKFYLIWTVFNAIFIPVRIPPSPVGSSPYMLLNR